MAISQSIFKDYDVRGIYPNQITEDAAYKIARAFVAHMQVTQVAVGRDMRVSSPALAEAVIRGVTDQGAEAVNLDLVSTDELYFAVASYSFQSGVMITASHNPGDYNGMKFCLANAVPVSLQTGLSDVRDMVLEDRIPPSSTKGSVRHLQALTDYARKMHTFVHRSALTPLKIVVDASNGMAGMTIPEVFRDLPFKIIPLYFELDGRFPHHLASPLESKNLRDLQEAVREHGADLGAFFDGDADRMFLVDERGEILDGSMVVLLVAHSLLQKNPGATILYNLICSRSVPELIEREGGHAVRTRVGHSFIKAKMREENAIFGGEHSGHFYYRDFWFADSGMISLLVCLEIICRQGKPVSEIVHTLDKRCRSGEQNSKVADAAAKLWELKEKYKDGHIDELDGVTVQYDSWWFNVRPSNTEPLLRLNVEADSCEEMQRRRDDLLALIRN
ncbi:MAG: phosphomannomutase/phosphoglucomutase [Chloroflexi bacterium]|nr:phosphomannomutase/phosphoglucomutase [Chloroflexota bacterium]